MSPAEASQNRAAPATKRSWTDLGPRLASGIVLIVVAVLGLYFGGYIFAALIGAVFAGCYREWDRMVTLKPLTPVGGVLIGLVALSAMAYPLAGPWATLGVIAAAVLIGLVAERGTGIWRAGGLIFFGLVIAAALAIRGTTIEGMYAGLFLGAVIWLTDTGAFFTGRQIGGERLAPQISPGKTWSGAIGGLAFGSLAGLVTWLIVVPGAPWWIGLGLAFTTSVLGQVGDLGESALKRRFRIKDSGDIIPGHGGLMDRLDSLTFGVLFVFIIGWARGGMDGVAAGFLFW